MARGSVAIIVLYNEKKELLLQQRDEHVNNPLKWCFFGGHIEEGETPREAVLRECKEEIDYDLKSPIFLGEFHDLRERFAFIEKYDGKQELTLYEGIGMQWFAIEEISKLDRAKGVDLVLPAVIEFLNNRE